MDEQVVSVSFGKENFATNSASLSAFVVVAPFARTLPSKTYKRQGTCQAFPASAHPEINGTLYVDTVRIPEGTLMILQLSHKQFNSPILDGAMLLRTRATGPMLAIHASLPEAREANITGSFLMFQGRADILTPEEAAGHGLEIPRTWAAAFLQEEEVAECFTVSILAGESSRKRDMQVIQVGDESIVVPSRVGRRVTRRR